MQDVNWWLMVLSFLLGLVLTLVLLIRRVKREVPVYGTLAGGLAGAAGAAKLAGRGRAGAVEADDTAKLRAPKIDVDADAGAASPVRLRPAAAAGGAAGGVAADKFAGSSTEAGTEPYGPGSARVTAGAAAPSGFDIKGNEDSMLYHTTDSPSYKQTIAEVWFRDEPSAQRAGFTHWEQGPREARRGGEVRRGAARPAWSGFGEAECRRQRSWRAGR